MNSQSHKIILDGISIDTRKGVVTYSNGDTQEISSRLLAILECLTECNGAVVTYQDIVSKVWDEEVSESVLYQQMTLLRKLLQDNPQKPNFIRTIPCKGYQFIGDIHQKESETNIRSSSGKLKFALFSLGLLSLILSIMLISSKDDSKKSQLIHSIMPKGVVAVESFFDINSSNGRALNALSYLIRTHLSLNNTLHATPIASNTSVSDYRALQQHFSKAGTFTYLIKTLINEEGEKTTLSVKLVDLRKRTSKNLINIVFQSSTFSEVLPHIEKTVISKLKEMKLVSNQTSFLKEEADSSQLFIDSATVLQDRFNRPTVIKKSITKLKQHLAENPDNLAALTMLWDGILILLDQQNTFNVNTALELLDSSSKEPVREYPHFFRAHHARAEYYCRTQQYRKCQEHMSTSLKMNPFDYGVFGTLRFSYEIEKADSLIITQKNYLLNPFILNSVLFYRNDLLKTGAIEKATQLIDNHTRLHGFDSNWYYIAQTMISSEDQKAFINWQKVNEKESKEFIISRYLGYMLLNTHQTELANFWVKNGAEQDLPYFDIQVVGLMANIWQQKWDKKQWLKSLEYATQRKEFQNTLDRLYLAYFHLIDKDYVSAGHYIEEAFPEFYQDHVEVSYDNFRFLVYYNEVKKNIGDHRRVVSISHSLIKFLEEHSNSHPNSNPYFGLAEVEFYALNGDEVIALNKLNQAIKVQNWQPNAFWMWPPIASNPFLSHLSKYPEFHNLSTY
jgi:DNA-binding winged helix-turn-helix (wHTH) protein